MSDARRALVIGGGVIGACLRLLSQPGELAGHRGGSRRVRQRLLPRQLRFCLPQPCPAARRSRSDWAGVAVDVRAPVLRCASSRVSIWPSGAGC